MNADLEESPRKSPGRRSLSFDPRVAAAIGRVIRRRREESGCAQDAFALKAKVDRSFFGKLERGERQPTLGLLLRIANALEVPCADLVRDAEMLLAEAGSSEQKT